MERLLSRRNSGLEAGIDKTYISSCGKGDDVAQKAQEYRGSLLLVMAYRINDLPSLSWINTVAVPGLTTLSFELMVTWKVCVGSIMSSSTTGITTSRVAKLSSPVLKVTVALVLDGKSSGDTAVPFVKAKLKMKNVDIL